ncbi:MAG: hypothetical protein EBR33_05005 [Synechococcaceae bacterium WB4_1_0192]|nr:hypothetical protein [Synechococcaceae bacterium WB4_1_0192]
MPPAGSSWRRPVDDSGQRRQDDRVINDRARLAPCAMPSLRRIPGRLRRALPIGAAFTAGALLSAGIARADQPNMREALSQLYGAQASLQAAAPNKGGHRDVALRLISEAIEQVQLGIAFAEGR